MNILFLTLLDFQSLNEYSIYTDLLREFAKNGHNIYAVSPVERRKSHKLRIVHEPNVTIVKPVIGNTQKTNIIEKGISTVLIEPIFIDTLKKHFCDVKFDLVLYSTPPISFAGAIKYIKRRDNAKAYLLLKDIFPQNAVDLGMLKTHGPKSVIYKHFRKQEKKLYRLSDRIGCMSAANVDYVIRHNDFIDPRSIEVCPNSIDVIDKSVDAEVRRSIREKYDIPLNKKVFVYGGNLGRPQCVPFIIECLDKCKDINDAFFLIVGDGTDYPLLENYINKKRPDNFILMRRMDKADYDNMVAACDVGLIFLDHRFTIPNFPSRLLSYMQAKIPVLAATDPNTDVGKIITEGGFGWWCESNSPEVFHSIVKSITDTELNKIDREAEWLFLNDKYSVSKAYNTIIDAVS